MASQAAFKLEKAVGHDGSTITQQDVANYESTGDSSHTMKALVWQGKNKVEIVEVARPKIIEPRDVILKVTGSTLCGSDLHLLHGELIFDVALFHARNLANDIIVGTVIQMQAGDILGHEFCGVVDEVGSEVKSINKGGRYVASFQIACGDVSVTHFPSSAACFGYGLSMN